jgi:hypothetical protein
LSFSSNYSAMLERGKEDFEKARLNLSFQSPLHCKCQFVGALAGDVAALGKRHFRIDYLSLSENVDIRRDGQSCFGLAIEWHGWENRQRIMKVERGTGDIIPANKINVQLVRLSNIDGEWQGASRGWSISDQ